MTQFVRGNICFFLEMWGFGHLNGAWEPRWQWYIIRICFSKSCYVWIMCVWAHVFERLALLNKISQDTLGIKNK